MSDDTCTEESVSGLSGSVPFFCCMAEDAERSYVTERPSASVNQKLESPFGQSPPPAPPQLYSVPVRMLYIIVSIANDRLLMPLAMPCACRFVLIIRRYAPDARVMMSVKNPTATMSSTS